MLIFAEAAACVWCGKSGTWAFTHAPQISGADPCRSSVWPNYSASCRRTSLHDHKQRDNSRALSIKFGIVNPSFLLSLHKPRVFVSSSSTGSITLNPLSPRRYTHTHGKYYLQQEPSLKPQAYKNIAARPPATAAKLMP
jgi:hypothetical protein